MEVEQSREIPGEGNELTRAARQKIDDNISELKCRIQLLRVKRNELAPISILPLEVLSKIFTFVRDLSPCYTALAAHYPKHHAPWISVGHVCHHWREIALNYPSLWSVPVFSRPTLAQEMMHRSKTAPLTIRLVIATWMPRVLEQFESALAQIARIQSIELVIEVDTQKLQAIFSLLSQPTPLLENISLGGSTDEIGVSFPPDALANSPRLRSIGFHSINFSWESAMFKHETLTDLQLACSRVGDSTISQMIDTLHHLPNLRILELRRSIPLHTTSNGSEKPVKFQFLERLALTAEAKDCIFFLRHVHYPSSAKVTLQSISTGDEDGVTIFSLLGRNSCRAQSSEARSRHSPIAIRSARLTLEYLAVEAAFFDKVDEIPSKVFRSDNAKPIIQIRLGGSFGPTHAQDHFLTSISDSFDLSSLEDLLLDWKFTNNCVPVIEDSLGMLPNLKLIKISRSLPEICIALSGMQNRGVSSQHCFPPLALFPALQTLILQDAVSQKSQLCPDILKCLTDMLINRSNMDVPINTLNLGQFRGVRTWKMRRLAELVVDLEVGGMVIDLGLLRTNDCWGSGNSEDDESGSENSEDDESDVDIGYGYEVEAENEDGSEEEND